MRMLPKRRRWLLFASAGAAGAFLLILAVWWGGDGLLSGDMSGTMGSDAGFALGEIDAGWQGGVLERDRRGRLNDAFALEFEVSNSSRGGRDARYSLFFSRDEEFDAGDDCRVGEQRLLVPAGGRASVSFRSTAHLVDCLDAGEWYAAVLDEITGDWTVLDEPYSIHGGEGQMKLAGVPPQIGHRAAFEMQVDVARQAGSIGVEGLWQHPVDVWLRHDDETCLVVAQRIDLERDPIRRAEGSWVTNGIKVGVKLREAVKVTSLGDLDDPFLAGSGIDEREVCAGCTPPEMSGRCSLKEGEWQVAVGPTSPEWRKVETIYLHAAPVTIDPTPMEITLSEGGVGTVERMAYNPGRAAVRWASSASDEFAQDWLVGMTNQALPGRKPAPVQFTFSATDLAPGFYSGEFVFTAEDFYGTEVRIPVELTVMASRTSGTDPSSVQPVSVSNYPNPFRGRTTLQIQIENEGRYKLAVYDIQGREVRLVLDDWLGSGQREVSFDAQDLPSGTYLYRLTGDGASTSGTMSLVK